MSERKMQVRKNGLRLTWTEEELDYVFNALSEGKSAGVTCRDMTKAGMRSDCGPITRNAIVGIWNRYPDRKAKAKKPTQPLEVIPNPSYATCANNFRVTVPVVKKKERPKIPHKGITFEQLQYDNCRFIYGDMPSNDIRYCGHPVEFSKSRSFCAQHYALCYVPARKS